MSSTLVLGIETCTPYGGIALADGERGLLAHHWIYCRTGYSRRLMATIDSALGEGGWKREEIAAIAVSRGPGAFTGVRVGLVTAKTLAFSLQIPLYSYSTLDSAALRWPLIGSTLCVALDARRNEIYSGVYQITEPGHADKVRENQVEPCDRLLDWLASETSGEVWFSGDGAVAYQKAIMDRIGSRVRFVPPPWNRPGADSVALQGVAALLGEDKGIDPFAALPEYLRASDAERNLAVKLK